MKTIQVRYQGWGENWPLGTLADNGQQLLFEYSPQALDEGVSLSPRHLPLQKQAMGHFPSHQWRLPGLFADSLPDGWGMLLMDRLFRKQGLRPEQLSPLDRLSFIGHRGMGALTYQPDSQGDVLQGTVDLVALAPGAHLRWLLGFAPFPDERPCLALISQRAAGFLMPALNADDVRQHCDWPFWEWADDSGPDAALARALEAMGPVASVSLDETMRADHALRLLEALPGATRGFAAETVGHLRLCKDAAEIAALRENARIADLAQQALRAALRPGITERELADTARAAFRAEGAVPEFTIIGAGANGAFPHHHTGETVVKPGDAIVCDIGGRKQGYYSDITRMAICGPAPEGYAAVHAVVDAAVQAALATIRPGIAARDVDAAARRVITDAGYGAFFTHRTGHGVGQEIHEPPYITGVSDVILQPGMVFTVEPGIYLPGRFGIRLEEVAVVTETGCEILSRLPRDAFIA